MLVLWILIVSVCHLHFTCDWLFGFCLISLFCYVCFATNSCTIVFFHALLVNIFKLNTYFYVTQVHFFTLFSQFKMQFFFSFQVLTAELWQINIKQPMIWVMKSHALFRILVFDFVYFYFGKKSTLLLIELEHIVLFHNLKWIVFVGSAQFHFNCVVCLLYFVRFCHMFLTISMVYQTIQKKSIRIWWFCGEKKLEFRKNEILIYLQIFQNLVKNMIFWLLHWLINRKYVAKSK